MPLTLLKIISLALVDAINPCAFAVMIIVLLSILLATPDNKKKVGGKLDGENPHD